MQPLLSWIISKPHDVQSSRSSRWFYWSYLENFQRILTFSRVLKVFSHTRSCLSQFTKTPRNSRGRTPELDDNCSCWFWKMVPAAWQRESHENMPCFDHGRELNRCRSIQVNQSASHTSILFWVQIIGQSFGSRLIFINSRFWIASLSFQVDHHWFIINKIGPLVVVSSRKLQPQRICSVAGGSSSKWHFPFWPFRFRYTSFWVKLVDSNIPIVWRDGWHRGVKIWCCAIFLKCIDKPYC